MPSITGSSGRRYFSQEMQRRMQEVRQMAAEQLRQQERQQQERREIQQVAEDQWQAYTRLAYTLNGVDELVSYGSVSPEPSRGWANYNGGSMYIRPDGSVSPRKKEKSMKDSEIAKAEGEELMAVLKGTLNLALTWRVYRRDNGNITVVSPYHMKDSKTDYILIYDKNSNTLQYPNKRAEHLAPMLKELAKRQGWNVKGVSKVSSNGGDALQVANIAIRGGDTSTLFKKIADGYGKVREEEPERLTYTDESDWVLDF